MKTTLVVTGMSCGNCVNHVREALEAVAGVSEARVVLEGGVAEITHENADVSAMLSALEEEGYSAEWKH